MILDNTRKALEELVAAAGEAAPAAAVAPPVEGAEAPVAPVPGIPCVLATEYATTGFHLDATVLAEQITRAAELLLAYGFFIETITGVDWLKENQLEVIYDFNHWQELCRVVVRVRLDRGKPEIPTISGIYQGANWHERETHDFFGIVFTGHPDLSPLLLPEDADFHPLLKDYQP